MISVFFFTGRLCGGGSERVTSILANYLVRNGESATVVTVQPASLEDYPLDNQVSRICLSEVKGKTITLRLKKVLKENKVDVLVSMAVPISLYAIPAALATKTKIIVSERSDPAHSQAKKMTLLYSRFLLNFATGFVFQTKGAQSFYNRKIQNRSVIIGNPLRGDLPEPFRGVRSREIVTAGRLTPLKNHKMLIRSFDQVHHKHPDYKLTIYGEGTYRGELERIVKSLNLSDCVSLPGFATDVNNKIRQASIFAFTSDYEGLPNSVLEAMGMGLPVVATDCPCGGVASIVTHGYDGVLINVGDENALTSALLQLIEDDSYSRKIGLNAEEVRIKFAENNICSQWHKYILRVIG